MPPFEIQVFSPSMRTCSAPSGVAAVAIAATSEPASGSESAKAAIASPARDRRQPALLLRLGAEQRDRPAAQPLHGEGEVGEPVRHRRASRGPGRACARRSRAQPPWPRHDGAQPAALAERARRARGRSRRRRRDRSAARSPRVGPGAAARARSAGGAPRRTASRGRCGPASSVALEDRLLASRRRPVGAARNPRSSCTGPAPPPRPRSPRRRDIAHSMCEHALGHGVARRSGRRRSRAASACASPSSASGCDQPVEEAPALALLGRHASGRCRAARRRGPGR